MQATAFMPQQRAVHDQGGNIDQVAQFEQVGRDTEACIVLVYLALEQADAFAGAAQALGGAHDADEIPHAAAQFVPILRNDHFLVGIGDPAFVPVGQGRYGHRLLPRDVFGGGAAQHQAFQQRVAGQAIGAMQAGAGSFANRIQARQVGAPGRVRDNAAAGVMGGRHDRYRLRGDVDAEFKAARQDVGEVFLQERRTLMADVEVHMVQAALLHFVVDSARDDVARR